MTKTVKKINIHKLVLLIVLIIFSIVIVRLPVFHNMMLSLGELGYISGFLAGVLFVNVFTAALGIVLLLTLAEVHNIVLLSLIGGAGAVVGDLFIFNFIKYSVLDELHILLEHFRILPRKFPAFLSKGYFQWTLPLLGAIIIASPFPDELGISLMGLSKISPLKFALLVFVLNTLGILSVLGIFDFVFYS